MDTLYMFQFLFIVIFSLIRNSQMEDMSTTMQQKQQQESYDQIKKYCGKHLTDALSALCQGNYQTSRPVRIRKKNYWESQFFSDMPASPDPSEYPLQNSRKATNMLENFGKKRRRRGVYNECCEKPCTREQLSMYCAAPMIRRR